MDMTNGLEAQVLKGGANLSVGWVIIIEKNCFPFSSNKRVVVKTKTADLSSPGHCESIKNINNRRGHRQCWHDVSEQIDLV